MPAWTFAYNNPRGLIFPFKPCLWWNHRQFMNQILPNHLKPLTMTQTVTKMLGTATEVIIIKYGVIIFDGGWAEPDLYSTAIKMITGYRFCSTILEFISVLLFYHTSIRKVLQKQYYVIILWTSVQGQWLILKRNIPFL